MTPRDSSAAADANPNASPPRSPDGLGDKLRALAEKATPGPWEAMDFNGRVDVTTMAAPLKIVATVSGEVRENGMMFRSPDHGGADGAFIAACDPQTIIGLLDRIDTLTEQVAENEWFHYGTVIAELRSENARLTEQVRGAGGVVRDLLAHLAKDHACNEKRRGGHAVIAAARKSLSIYDEGAGGRSGSASPAGDGVSGVDAVLHRERRAVK